MIGGMDDEFVECHRRTICTSLYPVYTTHSYFPTVVRAFEAIRGIIPFVYEIDASLRYDDSKVLVFQKHLSKILRVHGRMWEQQYERLA